MTNYVLCEAGVVLQSDRTGAVPVGWIEAPEHVTPGYLYDGHDFHLPRPSLDECFARLAARRWEAQTAGIVFNGVPIKTDERSTANLTSAYVKAKANSAYVVSNWKVDQATFVTLDAATIIAIGDAVTAHVKACFDNESVLSAALLGTAEYETVDLEQGWP